jgi:hypothetical protein
VSSAGTPYAPPAGFLSQATQKLRLAEIPEARRILVDVVRRHIPDINIGDDMNNDGRLDVLVTTNGGAPLLLRNNAAPENHWIGLKLRGTKCNRDAIGVRITWSAGGVRHSRFKTGGGSYLSSHDPREVLGIGQALKADWVEVRWPGPDGGVERYMDLRAGQYQTIVQK